MDELISKALESPYIITNQMPYIEGIVPFNTILGAIGNEVLLGVELNVYSYGHNHEK